jgi:23S rRNA (adenine2503-C2)-methyltransferase
MTDNVKINFYNLSFPELKDTLKSQGEPEYRALQIWKGIYQNLWEDPDQFTNIPHELKRKLNDLFSFQNLEQKTELSSRDHKTIKTLFLLQGGHSIESVLMGYDQRQTLCISTQAGCAMGCVFCATGQMGFKRNLTSGEIVEQILFYARQLNKNDQKVTNIVMMGMGEPFHNYQNTIDAIDRLNDPTGYNFGERRFTISTVGIIPMIEKFAQAKRQINLAISLHAPNDELRVSMLPVNKKYPIKDLIAACKNYTELTHRRITFEYALVDGVNDTPALARELGLLLRGMLCHVNLIPLNPTHNYNGKGSSQTTAQEFSDLLNRSGITTTIRLRRGIDIQAGCGQLAIQNDKENPV